MARPKRPRQSKSQRRYELWSRIESLHCQVNLEPLRPGVDPEPMDNAKAEKWYVAHLQKEKALIEWLGRPGERLEQLKREARC